LFEAAMDYLPIQGSAVPCERVFSSAKETMSNRRNRILYGLMEQLQMLKFSFTKGRPLNFMGGTNEKDILSYIEQSLSGAESVPEDIRTFMRDLISHKPSETDLD
jgi:hypothetical protein